MAHTTITAIQSRLQCSVCGNSSSKLFFASPHAINTLQILLQTIFPGVAFHCQRRLCFGSCARVLRITQKSLVRTFAGGKGRSAAASARLQQKHGLKLDVFSRLFVPFDHLPPSSRLVRNQDQSQQSGMDKQANEKKMVSVFLSCAASFPVQDLIACYLLSVRMCVSLCCDL